MLININVNKQKYIVNMTSYEYTLFNCHFGQILKDMCKYNCTLKMKK